MWAVARRNAAKVYLQRYKKHGLEFSQGASQRRGRAATQSVSDPIRPCPLQAVKLCHLAFPPCLGSAVSRSVFSRSCSVMVSVNLALRTHGCTPQAGGQLSRLPVLPVSVVSFWVALNQRQCCDCLSPLPFSFSSYCASWWFKLYPVCALQVRWSCRHPAPLGVGRRAAVVSIYTRGPTICRASWEYSGAFGFRAVGLTKGHRQSALSASEANDQRAVFVRFLSLASLFRNVYGVSLSHCADACLRPYACARFLCYSRGHQTKPSSDCSDDVFWPLPY